MSSRLAALAVLAAVGVTPPGAQAIDVVTLVPASSVKVKPGASAQIALRVVVKSGYHVQANPVENPSLIPTTLSVDAAESVSVGKPVYPAGRRMRLPGDTQDLVVYDGTFTIALPFRVAPSAVTGAVIILKGALRHQACDDSHCLFPVTLPVALTVTVGGG